MIRPVVLFAASCLLSACATLSPRAIDAPRPAPQACDPLLTAEAPPEPPVQGSIVQPATDEERAATALFLEGEARARDWGREGWARAGVARRRCLTDVASRAGEPVPTHR